MAVKNPETEDARQTASSHGIPTWWWILALLLLAWTLVPLLQSAPGHHENDYPYSAFVAQVRVGNVKDVQIAGERISGTFNRPVLMPANGQAVAMSATSFHTTFPSVQGDTRLLPLLESHKVSIAVSPASAPWYVGFLNWLPFLLLIGYFVWLSASAARRQGGLSSFGNIKSHVRTGNISNVTFHDIAGAAEAKADLQEEVDFLRNPKKYHALGARIPRGILLVGAPGTGKTLLGRAVAGEAGVPFFSINASEVVEMFVGVGASRVRDLFSKAKAAAPAIVFIDELDAVGRRRGAGLGTVNDEREQTLNQLLGELDGFDPRTEVILLAATNRPDVLDPALLRPGRFDRQVTIDMPDADDRLGILAIHARALPLADNVDLQVVARSTIGFSGADLANLCNEAALIAARHDHKQVTMPDFEEANDKLRMGAVHRQIVDPTQRRVIAYHEAGHALAAWLDPLADPVQKVTIVPRGQSLGHTQQIPESDRRNFSLPYLQSRLSVMLGGRIGEEIALGEITSGAENDLIEATKLARRMVTRWAMGDLGLVAYSIDEQQPFLGYEITQGREYSDETAAAIDRNVRSLLDTAYQNVRDRLQGARTRLDQLAAALLKSETVTPGELQQILGARDVTAIARSA